MMESIDFCKYCRFIIDKAVNNTIAHKSKLYVMINPDAKPPPGHEAIMVCGICREAILNNLEEETDGFIVIIP